MLTLEYLKAILSYNPNTGIFNWLIDKRGTAKAGCEAGGYDKDGYRRIKINKKYYQAHRLAFFYMTGEWPKNLIDHGNGIKDDNRWLNLKDATRDQNNKNKIVSHRLGIKGIIKQHKNTKFIVVLKFGPYSSKEEAQVKQNEMIKKFFNVLNKE